MKLRISSTVVSIALALITLSSLSQTAAEWAVKEEAKLKTISKGSLIAIAKEAPESYRKLFEAVKTDYKSDPVELTRIAALTQIIATSAKPTTRSAYADELLAAAQKAEAADVACFFIDQLRWCATPKQSAGIKALTKSEKKGVAAIAAIAALAAERNFESQQKDIKSNVYSEYSAQIAKLRSSQKVKALISGFENADLKIAGIAMREAAQIEMQAQIAAKGERQAVSLNKSRHAAGKEETKLWCQTLSKTSDTTRQIMLLDMLGTRGNPEAVETLGEYIGYADTGVSWSAQQAMIKIDPAAYVAALPEVMKNMPGTHTDIMKRSLACVPVKLIEDGLIEDYDSYSQAGKEAVMEALKVRKSDKGVKLALTAIDSTAAETAKSGYRLLRECAGPDEAEVLVAKLMKERHSRSTLVQEAIAGAAKRDTTGTYVKLLEDAWPNAKSQDQKLSLLGAFGRVSDSKLLPLAESALKDSDSEVSTAAVRALAAWSNNDSINNLMSIAYTSDDSKQRILAQRGIEKKLEAKGVDKAPFKKEWEKVSSGAGDADIKKKLNDFFSK